MLDLMERGFTAEQALRDVVAATPHAEWRQLAAIDASGGTAAFSGACVKPEHGEAHGRCCVAIANIVRSLVVPSAMVRAFDDGHDYPLPDRLLSALRSGQEAGSEFRPLVSAALLVVYQESFPYVDLRVDRHEQPIEALATLWENYRSEADAYVVRAISPGQATSPT